VAFSQMYLWNKKEIMTSNILPKLRNDFKKIVRREKKYMYLWEGYKLIFDKISRSLRLIIMVIYKLKKLIPFYNMILK